MENERRYFVKIEAPSRRALIDLGTMGLDLFAHSTVVSSAMLRTRAAEGGLTEEPVSLLVEGLVTLGQVEQLVQAGYRVTVEEEAAKRARTALNVIEFEQWLKAMGE
jgi:hypothetical protein